MRGFAFALFVELTLQDFDLDTGGGLSFCFADEAWSSPWLLARNVRWLVGAGVVGVVVGEEGGG